MKHFEYKIEVINIDVHAALHDQVLQEKLSNILNEYGKKGWRLCGVNGALYYFTRQLIE